jgi:hypothetical protein
MERNMNRHQQLEAAYANLTAVQARCNELLQETRALKDALALARGEADIWKEQCLRAVKERNDLCALLHRAGGA